MKKKVNLYAAAAVLLLVGGLSIGLYSQEINNSVSVKKNLLIAKPTPCSCAFCGNETSKFRRVQNAVPNQYIVVLDDNGCSGNCQADVKNEINSLKSEGYKFTPKWIYTHAIKGFSATMNSSVALKISQRKEVKYVIQNAYGQAANTATRITGNSNKNKLWGLDRIDETTSFFDYNYTYNSNSTGIGVNVFVIDYGIFGNHNQTTGQFQGRAKNFFSYNSSSALTDNRPESHGTRVAGIIGGRTVGVAAGTALQSVRIGNNGNYVVSDLIAGIDAVCEWKNKFPNAKAVANISLRNCCHSAVDSAVKNLIAKGVTTVVAAGNDSADTSCYSPARVNEAIVVAAATKTDQLLNISNFGSTVDVLAPGEDIFSANKKWTTQSKIIPTSPLIRGIDANSGQSGTSFAAPFVSGIAARILQNGNQTPAAIENMIKCSVGASACYSQPLPGLTNSNVTNRFIYASPAL